MFEGCLMKTVHLYDVSNHEVSAESDYHQRGYLENYRFCDGYVTFWVIR